MFDPANDCTDKNNADTIQSGTIVHLLRVPQPPASGGRRAISLASSFVFGTLGYALAWTICLLLEKDPTGEPEAAFVHKVTLPVPSVGSAIRSPR